MAPSDLTLAWTTDSLGQLEGAIAALDRSTAETLCDRLVRYLAETNTPFPEREAKRVLRSLRTKRYFDLMERVADALIQSGQTAPQIRRQYAQALIDQSELTAAMAVLDGLLADPKLEPSEQAEARGLRGRVLKQRYVNAPTKARSQQQALDDAIEAYHRVYNSAPTIYLWHGINAVALGLRAERDGVQVRARFDARAIARDILAVVRAKPSDSTPHFDLATAAEACVALGLRDDALGYVKDYLGSPDADAFDVASFLRQLREVWQVDAKHPMSALVVALEAALLRKQGGCLEFPPGRLGDAIQAAAGADAERGLEHLFGANGPIPLAWYKRGIELAQWVGKVGNTYKETLGTGFLVRAGDFFPGRASLPPDEALLLTNAHVLGQTWPSALRQDVARVRFEFDSNPFAVRELVWESPVDKLDATFVRLDRTVKYGPVLLAPAVAPTFAAATPRRLYIIGYALGRELSLSLNDNEEVGWAMPRLHYRTPTANGSSGSPVYDEDWRLIALHHKGLENMQRLDGEPGVYEANEGIWIHAVREQTLLA